MSVRGFRLNGVVHKYAYDALDNKPTPDTTLTESGKPADSKAVGDAISEVRQAVGSPLVATTAAAMTDTSKIYVYTGSESGYTSGNWYYYNGTSWVSGGVYNSSAVETDKTLSVSDKAADAKTVGDRIAEVAEAAGIVDAIAPEFELKAYSKGDLVFYENVLYQANTNTYPVDIEGQPVWPSASFDEVTIDDVINGDIVNLIARRFINNEGWIREVGTYVVYGDKLYRVTEANSDTIWNASKYVEVASIGAEMNNIKSSVSVLGTTVSNLSSDLSEAKDDITELKNDLTQITGIESIPFTYGYYIRTSDATVDPTDLSVSESGLSCAVVNCVEGDAFTVYGSGGASGRLWCFADSGNNVLDVSGASETLNYAVIVAPTDSAKCIFNANAGYFIVKGVLTKEQIADLKKSIEYLSAIIQSGIDFHNVIDTDSDNYRKFTAGYSADYTETESGFIFKKNASATYDFGLFFPVVVGHDYKLSYHVERGASTNTYVMYNANYPSKLTSIIPEYALNTSFASTVGNDYEINFSGYSKPECCLAFKINYQAQTHFEVSNLVCIDVTTGATVKPSAIPIASGTSVGGIKVGSGLEINDGTLSVVGTTKPTQYNGFEFGMFNKCLCIGDSLTQGEFNHNEGGSNQTATISKYSYPTQLQKISGVQTTNLGNGGYTSEDWYTAHENDNLSGYDVAIISLGTNDAAKGLNSGTTQTWLQSIITKLKNENTGIKIFVSNLLPAMKYNTQPYTDVQNYISAVCSVNTDTWLLDMTQYSECKRNTAYAQEHLTALGYVQEAKELNNYISYIINGNKADFKWVQFIGTNYSWND